MRVHGEFLCEMLVLATKANIRLTDVTLAENDYYALAYDLGLKDMSRLPVVVYKTALASSRYGSNPTQEDFCVDEVRIGDSFVFNGPMNKVTVHKGSNE